MVTQLKSASLCAPMVISQATRSLLSSVLESPGPDDLMTGSAEVKPSSCPRQQGTEAAQEPSASHPPSERRWNSLCSSLSPTHPAPLQGELDVRTTFLKFSPRRAVPQEQGLRACAGAAALEGPCSEGKSAEAFLCLPPSLSS